MLYEYRRYEIMPGRLPQVNKRFAEITAGFFEKHGIRVVGFFEPMFGSAPELHYILAWESLAEREQKWDAFQRDEERLAAFAKTEAGGPLVQRIHNSILRPTHYSPMK